MKKYYILSIDSFINTFSMTDAAASFMFSMEMPGGAVLGAIRPGDIVIVYRKPPAARMNMYLQAVGVHGNKIEFRKIVEVAEGVDKAAAALDADIDRELLTEIEEAQFMHISGLLLQPLLHAEGASALSQNADRRTGAENILLYGVPGVGKSHAIQSRYCSDSTRMERVVFHPDYTYSDFVGQILPRVEDGQLHYVFTPGPFTKLLQKAWDNPANEYYLVIEEINRGNAPAIFGEIFQLLDRKTADSAKYPPSEYGESEYAITNYDIAKIVFENEDKEIRLPSNLWILATMNTADQNVFTLDTAFQRRWNPHHIKNNIMEAEHAKEKIEGTRINWGSFAAVINEIILDMNADMASAEDKSLGAYFIKKSELTVNRFPGKALKYMWDDVFRMDRDQAFGREFKSLEQIIETYEQSGGDKLKAVLQQEVYRRMLHQTQQAEGEAQEL